MLDLASNLDLPWNPAKLEQRIARTWRKQETTSTKENPQQQLLDENLFQAGEHLDLLQRHQNHSKQTIVAIVDQLDDTTHKGLQKRANDANRPMKILPPHG